MKRVPILSLLLLMTSLSFGQEPLEPERLLSLLMENNPQWEKILLERQRGEMSSRNASLPFSPYLYGTPFYSLESDSDALPGGSTLELWTHTGGLVLGGSLLLPSRGTLGLSLTSGWSFLTAASFETHAQTLTAGLTFEQPLLTGNKFLNGSAYGAERRTSVDIPRHRAELNCLAALNALAGDTLAAYLGLILQEEEYGLNRRRQDLQREELNRLSSLRERGLYSGTDYWKVQLETDQGEDDLLEEKYRLESARASLASALGLETVEIVLPPLELAEADLPPLPGAAPGLTFLEGNRDKRLSELTEEEARLRMEGGLDESATLLSVELTLSPQYDPSLSPSRNPAESFSDLFADGSWWETALTISLTYSPRTGESNRYAAERSRLAFQSALIDREEKEEELLSELFDLLERDDMLRTKLARIGESILYQKSLLEREEKLLSLSSGTRLAVEEARLNVELRDLDRKKTLVELYKNRLDIRSMGGEDLWGVRE